LEVVDQRYVAIYCLAGKFSDCDSQLLTKIKSDISRLTTKAAEKLQPISTAYEYTVPHALALGDVAAEAKTLNFSALKIEAVGHDKIRVSKADGVSEQEFDNQRKIFEKDLDHLAWQIEPESPIARVYYLDAAPVSDVLNANKPPTTGQEAPAPTNPGGEKPPGNAPPIGNSPEPKPPATPSAGAAAKPATTNTGRKAVGAVGAKPRTPKGEAGAGAGGVAKLGSPKAGGIAGVGGSGKPGSHQGGGNSATPDANQAAAKKPANAADTQPEPPATSGNQPGAKTDETAQGKHDTSGTISITAFNPDLLVFADKNRGDDREVAEQKRILAGIDFPRPEVIINTFSFQMSSSDSVVLAKHDRILRTRIGTYNDSIRAALYRAWFYFEQQMTHPEFFDRTFYEYLTKRFVGSPRPILVVPITTEEEPATSSTSPRGMSTSEAIPNNHTHTSTATKTYDDYCNVESYCLGYTSLFHPLRPILTDLLFAAVASANPGEVFRYALEQMQGFKYQQDYPGIYELSPKLKKKTVAKQGFWKPDADCAPAPDWSKLTCDEKDIWAWKAPANLPAAAPLPSNAKTNPNAQTVPDAQAAPDAQTTEEQIKTARNVADQRGTVRTSREPRVFPMFCFRDAIEAAYPPNRDVLGYNKINLGLPLRAALANFLFHYKMAVQYPHEFSGYDLSESAQELNSELNPLIIAFNRDLAAALEPLGDVANCDVKDKIPCGRFGKGTTKFVNNGMITVRTISGKKTTVDTVTQNFFDATNPPSITDIINSIGKAESNIPNVLKTNLTANEAAVIIGALNSVPTATAQVGRQFSIEITPRSLSGASSAELSVNLKTSDVDTPKKYTSEKSENDNLSRIASQTVDTKVRLESVKLFEVSSFTATMERSRRDFPILPPFVEIPYFGSFLSYPLQGATEFHRSTAIMSAVVVPTAADLANGVSFTSDRVCVPLFAGSNPTSNPDSQASGSTGCRTRKAVALRSGSCADPGVQQSYDSVLCFCVTARRVQDAYL
jgi:hypothetical protein